MLEILQMFLFLFKSKYRRKCSLWLVIYCVVACLAVCSFAAAKCSDTNCSGNGVCKNETCICYDGWQGPQCQFCGGKVRLGTSTGTIHDGLGNYSLSVKCSWLIDAPNATITLHLEEFATECGWDHLYIYDGDSVDSPLLAVFSGLMYNSKGGYGIRRIPEVVAHSGSALVHFFSDDAFNMSGFNMTYRLNACPSKVSGVDCSGNGICIEGVCTCDGRWTGSACHLEKCPDDCGRARDRGVCEPETGCRCDRGYKGDDCGQAAADGYWETVRVQGFVPPGSASHGAVVWRDSMYVVGGESYTRDFVLYVYDFNGNVWETHHIPAESPSQRYGHSTVIYGDKIFLYGGVLGNRGPTSELWAFDISAKTWENISVKAEACNGTGYLMCGGPLKSAGHTATVVVNSTNKKADRMIVMFGHSPNLGYLNTVQEYYFGTREWHIVNTRGYPVKGGYGHTATWDPFTGKIYVYGGIISENESAQVLSKSLYSYDPNTKVWYLLRDSPSARFLHTATFVAGGLMLVFGGNTHNDTLHSFGAKCYSAEFLAYDVVCDTWQVMQMPKDIHADLARFGHSAVVFEGSLYIYGGFDGQMLSDMLKYTPGSCDHYNAPNSCLSTRPGIKCIWDLRNGRCAAVQNVPKNLTFSADSAIKRCPELNRSSITQSIIHDTEKCEKLDDCLSCVQTTSDCVWCKDSSCTYHKKCRNGSETSTGISTRLDQCPIDLTPICKQLHTCSACTSQPFCRWRFESGKCLFYPFITNSTVEAAEPIQCQKVCSEYNSCLNCTQEECIWCQNEGRCVDKNAYTASFPYGQCREWTTVGTKCRSAGSSSTEEENSQCGFYSTCAKCRDDPACGWCDDGSKTGLGKCMPGGYAGPTLHTQSLPSSTCPPDRWHFTTCPLCQCNGHAHCLGNTSQCSNCSHLTTGHQCEHCIRGYWGNPVNGGKCQPCECNNQATHCHPETGKCYCTTKGLTGDHCEKCDVTNHYNSDPFNKDTCYYELTIDYQFTFNLSKKEDRHYTQINFKNSPIKADIDADFSITCSVLAKMNITIRRGNSKDEKPIYEEYNCTTFRSRFVKSEYNFGIEDNVTLTTFYVYVYDFQPPLWIQISFSQYQKLNLQQFFITFSSCFLLLLLVAAILWKIKQRYDMYRRRQRLFVEMEQMASRPFSQVLVELEVKERPVEYDSGGTAITVVGTDPLPPSQPTGVPPPPQNAPAVAAPPTTNNKRLHNHHHHHHSNSSSSSKKREGAPSPIALEPCYGNRAAVLSLLVRLPTGSEPYTVRGQSAGLAIASALVTLGNPRKMSVDQVKADQQQTKCGKNRKSQSQHPDSCL